MEDTAHHRRQARRQAAAQAGLGGLLIPVAAVTAIFGETLGLLTLLGVAAAYLLLAASNPVIRSKLLDFSRTTTPHASLGVCIPILVLSGIFGGPIVVAVAILVVGLAGFLMAMNSGGPSAPIPAPTESLAQTAPPALPAQAQGEKIEPLDVRALCRGLPPMQAGQVVKAVEELELAMAEAERRGNVKAAFDARQALNDYLPGTVEAWKAQRPEDQDMAELERALEEVRAIAGTTDGSAQRRAWETQQRFLKARAPQEGLPLEAGTGLNKK